MELSPPYELQSLSKNPTCLQDFLSDKRLENVWSIVNYIVKIPYPTIISQGRAGFHGSEQTNNQESQKYDWWPGTPAKNSKES